MGDISIFGGIAIGLLFIFLLIYIIINGAAITDINNKANGITELKNKMDENEKATSENSTSLKSLVDKTNTINTNVTKLMEVSSNTVTKLETDEEVIKTNKSNITDLTDNYNKLSTSVKDNTDLLNLNNFGVFTLTVVNDYSLIQTNKIKTSAINDELKNFYKSATYFNESNIIVVNNIKIASSDNDIKDTDYLYSLSEKDSFVYKTSVSFTNLNNLKLDSNTLFTFTTKTGTLYIKIYVFKIPDIEGNEFIFMILTHNTDLYPQNEVLIQSDLIKDINSKVGTYINKFKDPLIELISTLEQEYTEKFFSSFTFTKVKDYKKIQGDLEVIASNTDIKLYNSKASTKFKNLYDSYKKGISIYKLKQPECRSIFLN